MSGPERSEGDERQELQRQLRDLEASAETLRKVGANFGASFAERAAKKIRATLAARHLPSAPP